MTIVEKLMEAAKKHAEKVEKDIDFKPYHDTIRKKEKEFIENSYLYKPKYWFE